MKYLKIIILATIFCSSYGIKAQEPPVDDIQTQIDKVENAGARLDTNGLNGDYNTGILMKRIFGKNFKFSSRDSIIANPVKHQVYNLVDINPTFNEELEILSEIDSLYGEFKLKFIRSSKSRIKQDYILIFDEEINTYDLEQRYKYNMKLFISHKLILYKQLSVPNERSMIPGTPFEEIRSDGNNSPVHHYHPEGFGWEHYSLKTPLAWEISTGKPSIVHQIPDNFPGTQVDYIPQISGLTNYEMNIKSSINPLDVGNWLYFHTDRQDPPTHNLGNMDLDDFYDGDDPVQHFDFSKPTVDGFEHGTNAMGMVISKMDNDNLQKIPSGTPMGAKIGSCPECSGVATSPSGGREYELDIDMVVDAVTANNNSGVTLIDSRSHSTGASPTNIKENMDAGIVELAAGGNTMNNANNTPVTNGPPITEKIFHPYVEYYTDTFIHNPDPSKDVKIIAVGGLSNGTMPCGNYSGNDEYIREYNYSKGLDKFNISASSDDDRAEIRSQAQIDVVAPAFHILQFQNSNPNEGYKLGHGTSFATPFVAGIVDLMLSVNKRMGVPLDEKKNADQNLDPLDVQRRAYNVVTFTATKLIDNGLVPPDQQNGSVTTKYAPPIQPEYVEQGNDKLKRWWAQRMGFGKVNAYRAVAHSIRNNTPYTINSSYSLPFANDDGGSPADSRGYVNPDGNQLVHMGSKVKEGTVTQYPADGFWLVDDSRDPDPNNTNSILNVLEFGGSSNPTDPQKYNNHGVTLLEDNSRIELDVSTVGTKDQILAIDGSVIGLPATGNHKISTTSASNSGVILAEGYFKDIELLGRLRIGDLDIDASSNGIGQISFGARVDTKAEVYGQVTAYNNGQIVGNKGELTLYPESGLRAAGDNDIIIKEDSEWHMKGFSKISAVDISYDSQDFEVETQNDNELHVEAGAKLYIDENQKAELNIEVIVHPCAELIIEKDAIVRIKKLNVQVGGKLTVRQGAMLILEDNDHYLMGDNSFEGPADINIFAKTDRDLCLYKEINNPGTANVYVCNNYNFPSNVIYTPNGISKSPGQCSSCPIDVKVIQTDGNSEECCFKVQFRHYSTCASSIASSVKVSVDLFDNTTEDFTFTLTGDGLYTTGEICPTKELKGGANDIHLEFKDANGLVICQKDLEFECAIASCCDGLELVPSSVADPDCFFGYCDALYLEIANTGWEFCDEIFEIEVSYSTSPFINPPVTVVNLTNNGLPFDFTYGFPLSSNQNGIGYICLYHGDVLHLVVQFKDINGNIIDPECALEFDFTANCPPVGKLYKPDDVESIKLGLNVIPNPVSDIAKFEFNSDENTYISVEINDLLGQKVSTIYRGNSSEGYNSFDFNTSKLSSGSYVIKLNMNGMVYTYQFIKE